jgi:hypothetical protein
MRLIDCPNIGNRTKQVEGLPSGLVPPEYIPYLITINYTGHSTVLKAVPLDNFVIPYIQRAVNAHEDLVAALDKIHSWLVAGAIASPQDMAQSFPEMERIASEALTKAKGA